MAFYVYMLRCGNGTYYVGHTDDLTARLLQHESGVGANYTAKHLPVELVWSNEFQDREQAKRVEKQLKGWSRAKKEALMAGDWDRIQELAQATWQMELGDPGESDQPSIPTP